jgi:hypothetical protein
MPTGSPVCSNSLFCFTSSLYFFYCLILNVLGQSHHGFHHKSFALHKILGFDLAQSFLLCAFEQISSFTFLKLNSLGAGLMLHMKCFKLHCSQAQKKNCSIILLQLFSYYLFKYCLRKVFSFF